MFEAGERVGEMHLHTPGSFRSPLGDKGFETKSIFEIEPSVAEGIANTIPGLGFSKVARSNKEAYVISVSANDDVMVIYSYDYRYYLTTLSKKAANRNPTVFVGERYRMFWDDGGTCDYTVTDITDTDYGVLWDNGQSLRVRFECGIHTKSKPIKDIQSHAAVA